ncbi:MAG: transporter [Candidatus Riflebacteria bacterium]|nr:transporter [Candidatus Riflebacteria bacterium]
MPGLASLSANAIQATAPTNVSEKSEPIQDNSFLIEEAYNQETGVVQHINTFSKSQRSRNWLYTFTQEWPVPSLTHQLSYTLQQQRVEGDPADCIGRGDTLLNYRYQAIGDGNARVAFAPRFSVVLPTGDEKRGMGKGGTGYQVNLPISVVLSDHWVTHFNLGGTITPGARDAAGNSGKTFDYNFGESFIWLAAPTFNVMLELAYGSLESIAGSGLKQRSDSFYISPGFRWAINCKNNLQIVPGIAFPIGIGPSNDRAVFFYLSFEHPFKKVAK